MLNLCKDKTFEHSTMQYIIITRKVKFVNLKKSITNNF